LFSFNISISVYSKCILQINYFLIFFSDNEKPINPPPLFFLCMWSGKITKCVLSLIRHGSEKNIQPELRDYLSYVTFFLRSLEKSLNTSLTVLTFLTVNFLYLPVKIVLQPFKIHISIFKQVPNYLGTGQKKLPGSYNPPEEVSTKGFDVKFVGYQFWCTWWTFPQIMSLQWYVLRC
jgi:hypothetical protein